ncbi:MAG: hypothetical protein WCE25_00700, partial [Nitrososphaeraceae archaeon]
EKSTIGQCILDFSKYHKSVVFGIEHDKWKPRNCNILDKLRKSLLTIKEVFHLFLPRRIAAYFDKKSTSRVTMFDEQF